MVIHAENYINCKQIQCDVLLLLQKRFLKKKLEFEKNNPGPTKTHTIFCSVSKNIFL